MKNGSMGGKSKLSKGTLRRLMAMVLALMLLMPSNLVTVLSAYAEETSVEKTQAAEEEAAKRAAEEEAAAKKKAEEEAAKRAAEEEAAKKKAEEEAARKAAEEEAARKAAEEEAARKAAEEEAARKAAEEEAARKAAEEEAARKAEEEKKAAEEAAAREAEQEKAAEAEAEKPAEEPTEDREEQTEVGNDEAEKPAEEEPADAPTEAPAEEPTEAPTEEATDAPTEAPAEEPAEAPVEEATEEPTAEPTAEPTEEPVEPLTLTNFAASATEVFPGETINFTYETTGAERVEFAIYSGSDRVASGEADGAFSWTPGEAGSYLAAATAIQGGDSITDNIAITVKPDRSDVKVTFSAVDGEGNGVGGLVDVALARGDYDLKNYAPTAVESEKKYVYVKTQLDGQTVERLSYSDADRAWLLTVKGETQPLTGDAALTVYYNLKSEL